MSARMCGSCLYDMNTLPCHICDSSGSNWVNKYDRETRTNVVEPGDALYGYCNGFFGDQYGDLIVEAVGKDWIVARDEDGMPWFASFYDGWQDKMNELILEWKKEEEGI